jgi:hypothetical protein
MTVSRKKIFCNQVNIKTQNSDPFSPLGTSVPPCGVEGYDCRDAGSRATQEAKAEDEERYKTISYLTIPLTPTLSPRGEGVYGTVVGQTRLKYLFRTPELIGHYRKT